MSIVEFDHHDLAASDIHEWGRRFREELGIARASAHGGYWVVSRHADIVEITRDHETFVNSGGVTIPSLGQPVAALPTESDEPLHRRYRAVMWSFLTPTAVSANEEAAREIVLDAIASFRERGSADLVAELAQPVPARIMAHTFGFEDAEAQFVSDTFSSLVHAGTTGDTDAQVAAVSDYISWIGDTLADRRTHPRGDLASAIVKAKIDGRALTEDEAMGILWAGAAGAVETVVHAIGIALHLLATHPAERTRLANEPALMDSAVEEVLRLAAPAFAGKRTAVRDIRVASADMQAGDQVLLCWGWANRDAQAFDGPDEFALDRGTNRHLTFGHGIHKCVGMHLARQEVRLAMTCALQLLPDLELTAEVHPRLRAGIMWGFDSLPVRFGPRQGNAPLPHRVT